MAETKASFLLLHSRYQSGFTPPPDIPFEDLSKMDSSITPQSTYSNVTYNHMTMKGTISGPKLRKPRSILNSIFGSNKVRESVDSSRFWFLYRYKLKKKIQLSCKFFFPLWSRFPGPRCLFYPIIDHCLALLSSLLLPLSLSHALFLCLLMWESRSVSQSVSQLTFVFVLASCLSFKLSFKSYAFSVFFLFL